MSLNNLESVISAARSLAHEYSHKFITCEHLLIILLKKTVIKKLFQYYDVALDVVNNELLNYIKQNMNSSIDEKFIDVEFTTDLEKMVNKAITNNKSRYQQELCLLAEITDRKQSYAQSCLERNGITKQELLNYLDNLKKMKRTTKSFALSSKFWNDDKEDSLSKNLSIRDELTNVEEIKSSSALSSYCINLNLKASDGGVDCLVGRQKEIQRTIEILCRRRKNNALLVGEPGVGKTAIAEGLAYRIAAGDVPEILKNFIIYSLDIGSLLAGTKYRGDFENRIKNILIELKEEPNFVLFIDEIHNIIGAGSTTSGSLDAGNLLKPALSRGDLRCIGSTTFREYHHRFEKDAAMVRRFQKIIVDEPDEQATLEILKGLKNYYEEHHHVEYEDSALVAAVTLSERYIKDRNLPDKAIDLIDEAGARKKILQDSSRLISITARDIEELVASVASIPRSAVSINDVRQLKKLEYNLRNSIFGQNEAISQLCNSIKLSRAGLKKSSKPTGCYLFSGPTGVGKTELARQLAKFCNMDLIKFDMSEYAESYSISKLVGSSPGYAGFDQGGLLTEGVVNSPYSVILFDEIEKAHFEVHNLLLQIMDQGILTDNNGKLINFEHTFIILTANFDAEESVKSSIGFNTTNHKIPRFPNLLHQAFSPEFINRLDNVIVFNNLDSTVIDMIIDKNLKQLAIQLAEKKVTISLSKLAKKFLASNCLAQENGARALDKIIDTQIKQKIAEEILFGKLRKGGSIVIKFDEEINQLDFSFKSSTKFKTASRHELA
ncbi:MAG: AAA family ATPase [Rickettsiaceae bacterium]|nr:MAG: AAA family ATPase [Rickettsiaceae bacterium]